MSAHSEQSSHLQPLESPVSGGESFSTAQQQPLEPQAADVERGTTQNPWPPGTSLEKVYIARPSIYVIHIDRKGQIVQRQRDWVTATSLETHQSLPKIPPKKILVVISNIGADDEKYGSLLEQFAKKSPLYNVSRLDTIPYDISLKEEIRITKKHALFPFETSPYKEIASLEGIKSVARLNTHRLQELCQKRVVTMDKIFVAQSNIFISSLPSRPHPDRFYMLHEKGHSSCHLQSSAQTWYGGLFGFSLRFWEILSEVSVRRNMNGSVEILFTFPALRLPSLPRTPDPEMVTPAQSCFKPSLQSDQSSLRFLELVEDDAELAIKLIILDFLRTSMNLWENFLRRLTTSIALPHPNPTGLIGYERDLAHAIKFSSLVRDLCSCVSFLTSSVTLDYFSEKSQSSREWNHLLLELRTSEVVLQSSVQQLLDIARPKFDMAVADSTSSQATSLKRLTIIAIIFLPLSLASSLLAMAQSVQKLGELWFDWLGLWLTMGFVVALVYSVWKSIDHLRERPLAGRVMSDYLETVQNYFFPWLIPISCVIVVSFWIGMMDSLQAVPEALKWGFVAITGLVTVRLLWYISGYILAAFSSRVYRSDGKGRISALTNFALMNCEIYFNLKRLGGTYEDLNTFLVLYNACSNPDTIDNLNFSGVEWHGLVERLLKAAARSKRTRRYIQYENSDYRRIIEAAVQKQDQRIQEVVQEVRRIAATDNQVQKLLSGII